MSASSLSGAFSAISSASSMAVPLGASRLVALCISMISIFALLPSFSAAMPRIFRITFTTKDVLAAFIMGISSPAASSCAVSSSLNPVVPQMRARPCFLQTSRICRDSSTREKSMTRSQSSMTLLISSTTGAPISRPSPQTSPASFPM